QAQLTDEKGFMNSQDYREKSARLNILLKDLKAVIKQIERKIQIYGRTINKTIKNGLTRPLIFSLIRTSNTNSIHYNTEVQSMLVESRKWKVYLCASVPLCLTPLSTLNFQFSTKFGRAPCRGQAIRYNAFVRILTKAFSLLLLWFMQAYLGNLFHKICYFLSLQTSCEPVWL
ncbi:hypothetical protein EZS27_043503, partial [termite gut metagenome]